MANGLRREAFNQSSYDFWTGKYGVVNVKDFGAVGDGVHDDTAAIQAAVNAAAGNGPCLIGQQSDTFMIGKSVVVPNNSELIINGTCIAAPAMNNTMFLMDASTFNVVIRGNGILDGNKSAQTAPGPSQTNAIAVPNGSGVHHLTIRDITIQNCYNGPFNLVDVHDVLLDNLTLLDCGNAAGFAATSATTSYNCWAVNCHISGLNDEGFAFYGGVFQSGISNSLLHGQTSGSGISVLNDSSQTNPCHDITIENNICYGNSMSGIECNSGQSIPVNNEGITIKNNIIFNNTLDGIQLGAAKSSLVAGNLSHDNNGGGIHLENSSIFVNIVGNHIRNEGQGGTNGVGIEISSSSVTDILIENNMLFDDQSTKTMAYQLNGGGGSNIIARNNYLGPSIGQRNNLAVGAGNIFEGNHGYNPTGIQTSPTIPAASASIVNPFPYTVQVIVVGGAAVNIGIGNTSATTATGLASGGVTLAAGQYINLGAYTTAPTWVWIGL